MDNTFIDSTKQTAKNGFSKQEQSAYESIIDMLFRKNLKGQEKIKELDEYDGETLFGSTTLYPGQIYGFMYKAETASTYNLGDKEFKFYDKLPLVLITHIKGKVIRGINLNLCSPSLKTFIINALFNLDIEFYKTNCANMAHNKQAPISNKVTSVFLNTKTEREFIQFIAKMCNLKNTDILYRQYQLDTIKNIRMIEIW